MSNQNETVKERLLSFLESQKISKAEFSRRMGVSVAYLSAMRKSLPEEKVVRLTEIFPQLNRNWLLYGDGEMLKKEETSDSRENEYLVPLLPVEAYAGHLQSYSRGVTPAECSIIASPVKGAEMAIPITGDSMEPEIHNGTVAAICRINEKAFIPWGNPMVIDTENGVLIKAVYPSEKGEDYIEARSYNPRYPSIQIPTESVYGLYRIVAYMRKVSTI